MQLSRNFYELHCYVSDFICNNQFLANFEELAFLMNMSLYVSGIHKLPIITVCYYHVTYNVSFRLNLHHSIVCLNVQELFAQSRCDIWSLSDSNWIQTYNHFHRWTLNYLVKLWLSVLLQTKVVVGLNPVVVT